MKPDSANVLAIVPARGGSKRLPRKNLRPLAGKPLMAWTLDAARAAASLGRIVVSTEDDEIAACAVACGADVPIRRPADLAADETPGIEPILHMVRWLEEHEGYRPDLVMVLQPTSPLRTAGDIDASVELLRAKHGEAVVSVCESPFPGSWLRTVDDAGRLGGWTPVTPTQAAYVLNGAVYLTTREVLLARHDTYADPTWAYVMPRERSVDIDSAFDFELAEWLVRRRPDGLAE